MHTQTFAITLITSSRLLAECKLWRHLTMKNSVNQHRLIYILQHHSYMNFVQDNDNVIWPWFKWSHIISIHVHYIKKLNERPLIKLSFYLFGIWHIIPVYTSPIKLEELKFWIQVLWGIYWIKLIYFEHKSKLKFMFTFNHILVIICHLFSLAIMLSKGFVMLRYWVTFATLIETWTSPSAISRACAHGRGAKRLSQMCSAFQAYVCRPELLYSLSLFSCA